MCAKRFLVNIPQGIRPRQWGSLTLLLDLLEVVVVEEVDDRVVLLHPRDQRIPHDIKRTGGERSSGSLG